MIYNFDELTFGILNVDKFKHKKGVFDVKARPYSALSFRLSGEGEFDVAGKRFVSRAGDVLFLPADTPYKVEYSVGESVVIMLHKVNYSETENYPLDNSSAIRLLFLNLHELWCEGHSVNAAKAATYSILDKMASEKNVFYGKANFEKCIGYIEENFSDPTLDIPKMCEIAYTSPSGLQRSFKQYYGLSPIKFLIKLRMSRALELLTENKLSVKEIAFSVGFSDEKYFSRAFKHIYGYPPSTLMHKDG